MEAPGFVKDPVKQSRQRNGHDRRNQQNMAIHQILPNFRNAKHLGRKNIQAKQRTADGENPEESLALIHKQRTEIHQKGQSRQEQGAHTDIAKGHGIFWNQQRNASEVRNFPQADGNGEHTQINNAASSGFQDKAEIEGNRHHEGAQQHAQCGEDQQGQLTQKNIHSNGIMGTKKEQGFLTDSSLEQGGQHHRHRFTAMLLAHMDRAPVAADISADPVAFGTGKTVDQHILKIDINIMMGNIKHQTTFFGKLRCQDTAV